MNEIKNIDKTVIVYDYDAGFSEINPWYDGYHRVTISGNVIRKFNLRYLEILNYRDLARL